MGLRERHRSWFPPFPEQENALFAEEDAGGRGQGSVLAAMLFWGRALSLQVCPPIPVGFPRAGGAGSGRQGCVCPSARGQDRGRISPAPVGHRQLCALRWLFGNAKVPGHSLLQRFPISFSLIQWGISLGRS